MTGPPSERTAERKALPPVPDYVARLAERHQDLLHDMRRITQTIEHVRANLDCESWDNGDCPRCIAENAIAADEDAL